MRRKNQNIISDLMDSAVKVVARDGFDKASIRNISGECKLPNTYIYVHFDDKYDLFAKAFHKEDAALASVIKKNLSILNKAEIMSENRLYFLFINLWMYLIACPDSCRFYIQYYYSPLFQKHSLQDHLNLWIPIIERMQVLFRPEANVKAVLKSVLNTILCQAIEVSYDMSANMEASAQNSFKLILDMIRTHLSDE